jgi:hypothetical protein
MGFDFNKMLAWKLRAGSHKFPGPHGGTCINEAAIVAAGLEYRPVSDISDLPDCFSPVIAEFALRLNDTMPANLRQKYLMPFVLRLAGSADTRKIEHERAVLIMTRVMREIISLAAPTPHLAAQFRKVDSLERAVDTLRVVIDDKNNPLIAHYKFSALLAALVSLCPACKPTPREMASAVGVFVSPIVATAVLLNRKTAVYAIAGRILDSALAIGNQGSGVVEIASEHMESARTQAAAKKSARVRQTAPQKTGNQLVDA